MRPPATWTAGSWIALDLETTGTDPATCGIVEVGMALFEGGRCVGTDAQRCHPGGPIPAEATAVHGITDADVAESPPAELVLGLWLPRLTAVAAIVGYNSSRFDLPIVQRVLRGQGVFWQPRTLDLFSFVDWHFRAWKSRKLVTLAERYDVHLAQAHSAAADARACGEVLLRLVEEGHIPGGIEEATGRSAALRATLDDERNRWAHWIYRDRQDPQVLRLGCGKHQGAPLSSVDPGFLRWAMGLPDLPRPVHQVFSRLTEARP